MFEINNVLNIIIEQVFLFHYYILNSLRNGVIINKITYSLSWNIKYYECLDWVLNETYWNNNHLYTIIYIQLILKGYSKFCFDCLDSLKK